MRDTKVKKKARKASIRRLMGAKTESVSHEIRRDRQAWIIRQLKAGATCAELGEILGISRQRVHVISQNPREIVRSGRPEVVDSAGYRKGLEYNSAGYRKGLKWNIEFGRMLRSARRESGFSVSEAAVKLGMPVCNLSTAELGKSVSVATLLYDAAVLYKVPALSLWPTSGMRWTQPCVADGLADLLSRLGLGLEPHAVLNRLDVAYGLRSGPAILRSGKGTWAERLGAALAAMRLKRKMDIDEAGRRTILEPRAVAAIERGSRRIKVIELAIMLQGLRCRFRDVWPDVPHFRPKGHRMTAQGLAYLETKVPGVQPGDLIKLMK